MVPDAPVIATMRRNSIYDIFKVARAEATTIMEEGTSDGEYHARFCS